MESDGRGLVAETPAQRPLTLGLGGETLDNQTIGIPNNRATAMTQPNEQS